MDILIGMDQYPLTNIRKSHVLGDGIFMFSSFFVFILSGSIQPQEPVLLPTSQENTLNLEMFNPDDLQFCGH